MTHKCSERTTPFCVALATCESEAQAREIASAVVRNELAACANIVPAVKSLYIWEGELQEDSEALMILKTTWERVDELEESIKALHSYAVPEFIVLPLVAGSEDYLRWMAKGTAQKRKDSV